MSVDVDVLVAGAGAAGLSLAVRLAAQTRLRVLVLDARPGPADDRTFCFFRGRRHPFERAIARRYGTVLVRDGTREVRGALVERPYEELPGLAFAELALATISSSERVHVAWGTELRAFGEGAGQVRVETSRGSLSARCFIDARGGRAHAHAPRGGHDPHVRWLQHFVGHVVRTERPIFDPTVATLMDFEVPQDLGPHFVYVLPTSRHEALVEDTYFSPARLPRARYEATLEAWLARHGAGGFEVLRRESGAIPMTTAPQRSLARSRVVVLGQRGGAAKASSGYAFQFIQRQCDALVHTLLSSGVEDALAWQPPRSLIATFFDRVMLSFLSRHPTRAAEVFLRLFEAVPGDALARFLSEEGTALDHARVMAAVPRRGVLGEAFRSNAIWLRSR
ncbi:MAG: lycopene cyclase family protein [Deltaproteobacteria bacterium]